MSNHGCINGRLDDTSYSSPVPIIGLYIASASVVCMLLMSCDIFSGFRARRRWLPCKLYKLDSVTLTLLSIAAKIPVDLTTPMPRPIDQLSKLSGTAFICISMGFLMPSLGVSPESETFTNMVALSIFVITVFVNICMQLSTGAIVLFFAEHIIILCCLFLLLMTMWFSYWDTSNMKKFYNEKNKQIPDSEEVDGSLLHLLKISYRFGYTYNPQLVACLSMMTFVRGVICSLCSATLLQAAYRSLILKQLKFCSGNSDYDWSMPSIVVTQIVTVLIGNFAVTFRWIIMSKYVHGNTYEFLDREADDVIDANPILGVVSRLEKYGRSLRYAYLTGIQMVLVCIAFLPYVAYLAFMIFLITFFVDMNWDGDADEWKRRKSKEEMEIWINQSKSESCSNHLSKLLISRNYPYQQFDTMEVTDPSRPTQKGVGVSCLSIVLLVKIAQVSLPENHSTSLVQAFSEANQIFHYIDKRINPKNIENYKKLAFAKAVWAGENFSCLLPKIFNETTNTQPQSPLDRGLFIITKLKTILPYDPVRNELGIIVDFINRKTYSTLEELVTSVEQMFVNMVRVMLAQLPSVIFKSLSESTDEEHHENVKIALKQVCQIESFAEHVQWSFPQSSKFTSLATDDVSSADHSNRFHSDQNDVTIQLNR